MILLVMRVDRSIHVAIVVVIRHIATDPAVKIFQRNSIHDTRSGIIWVQKTAQTDVLRRIMEISE